MTSVGWTILLILLLAAIGLFAWVVLSASFVQIPTGNLGLLLIRGRPTDTALSPGLHFVPALRRRTVQPYPYVELSYRTGGGVSSADRTDLDCIGDPLRCYLGDRSLATVAYTVRFRLRPEELRLVHERFGRHGLFGLVRDRSAQVVGSALARPDRGVDDLFGDARERCRQAIADELSEALSGDGFEVTSFALGEIDLGRTGEVIQAVSRAPYELAREETSAAVRLAQAKNDAELAADGDPRRYRETDLWRELVVRRETLNVTLAAGPAADSSSAIPPSQEQPNGGGR